MKSYSPSGAGSCGCGCLYVRRISDGMPAAAASAWPSLGRSSRPATAAKPCRADAIGEKASRSAVRPASPDVKPVDGEYVAPPQPEPIAESWAVTFELPPTVLERHFGPAGHPRKCHLDFRAGGRIEAGAPPLEDETLTGFPHEDRSDLRALTAGKLLQHAAATRAGFKPNDAGNRRRNAEPRIAPPPQRRFAREDLERVRRIRRDDRRDANARFDVIHGAALCVRWF